MPFLFMLNDKLSNLQHTFVTFLFSLPVKTEFLLYAEKILELFNYSKICTVQRYFGTACNIVGSVI